MKNITEKGYEISLKEKINIKKNNKLLCKLYANVFFYYKVYKYKDINYPIRIDLYRAIDFIGPLR